MRSSGRATAGLLLAGLVVTVAALGLAVAPIQAGQNCAIEASEWTPRGSTRMPRPRIAVTFTSTCGVAIEASSARMTVDDEPVMVKAEGEGAKVAIVYVPSKALLEQADHTVAVQVADQKGTKGEKTWTFTLVDSYQR